MNLTLSPSGAITGVPNASETATAVTVQVTDSAGNKATAALTLTVAAVDFPGQVLSGTTPVNGAAIQLYAVGSAGNASAATPMLTQTVTSDALGKFTLTGLYTCGQSSTGSTIAGSNQVYLVATGGTTSTTSTTSNPALILVAAIGPCSNLASTPPLHAQRSSRRRRRHGRWRPSAARLTNIGATATNTLGITNAFLDAALLANPATGAAATLPAGLAVETGKLSALADALNSCTSAGACTPLFTAATPTGGTAPARHLHRGAQHRAEPGRERRRRLRHDPGNPTLRDSAPHPLAQRLDHVAHRHRRRPRRPHGPRHRQPE